MQRRRVALVLIALLALGDIVAAACLWATWQQRHGMPGAVASAAVATSSSTAPGVAPANPSAPRAMAPR